MLTPHDPPYQIHSTNSGLYQVFLYVTFAQTMMYFPNCGHVSLQRGMSHTEIDAPTP